MTISIGWSTPSMRLDLGCCGFSGNRYTWRAAVLKVFAAQRIWTPADLVCFSSLVDRLTVHHVALT